MTPSIAGGAAKMNDAACRGYRDIGQQFGVPSVPVGKSRNPAFDALLEEIRALHDRKNHDYAEDADPLLNFRQCESMGVSPWHGVEIRLCDKNQRIHGFIKRGGGLMVKDESIEDTLIDRAVYDLIAVLLYREEKGRNANPQSQKPE